MPVWHCPHCGTPQQEASRCWVCRRSTTSCATCRHYRRGVASGLGLCGLDHRRSALRGTEIRACWAAPDAAVEPGPPVSPDAAPAADRAEPRPGHRTFVPVDEVERAEADAAPSPSASTAVAAGAQPAGPATLPLAAGWSLWADLEA